MCFGGASAGINSFGGPYVAKLRRCQKHHDAENSAFCTAQTGVGAGKTRLSRCFIQDGDCSMHIKKRSYRTKLLNVGCGVWTTPATVHRQLYITIPPVRIAAPARARTIRETVLLPIPVYRSI